GACGEQTAEQRLVEVLYADEIDLVQAITNNGQATFALHFQQPREDAHVTGTGDEPWAQCQHFEAKLLSSEDLLLSQVFGGGIGMLEAFRDLFFRQPHMVTAIEIDRW